MSSGWPKPGIGHVAEYQVSGNAYVVESGTGTQTATLNFVTRAVVVSAAGSGPIVRFYDDGGNTKDFTFGAAGHVRFEIKCKKFALIGGGTAVSAVAELTNIPATSDNRVPEFTALGTTA